MPNRTVFIVDDSEIVLDVVRDVLESADYKVRTMMRWEELDRTLKTVTPDLILMDVNMPEVYGDFALAFFRETRGLKTVPILLYSDIDVDELKLRAEESEADGFVSKSWGTERLVEIVNQHIG
jgi:CheY-like chemotaxis protein